MLNELVEWLDDTALATLMREVSWAVPLVQTIHILAIAVAFSASLLLTFSTFGLLGASWPTTERGRMLIRWSWVALLVLLLSGALMVVGEAARSLLNLLFQIKMILLVVATLATWQLSRRQRVAVSASSSGSAVTRLLALGSLLLWLGIISAGRWIAYFGD